MEVETEVEMQVETEVEMQVEVEVELEVEVEMEVGMEMEVEMEMVIKVEVEVEMGVAAPHCGPDVRVAIPADPQERQRVHQVPDAAAGWADAVVWHRRNGGRDGLGRAGLWGDAGEGLACIHRRKTHREELSKRVVVDGFPAEVAVRHLEEHGEA
jgi:hypothetical protein